MRRGIDGAVTGPLQGLRPTRFGLAFLGLVLLTLVGCINYGLSLGYGLTFLLGGVWIITATQASRAARGVLVQLVPPGEATAGQDVPFTLTVRGGAARGVLHLTLHGGGARVVRAQPVAAGESLVLTVPLGAAVRGPLAAQLDVAALDGLGLWTARVPGPAPVTVLVRPAPEDRAPPPPHAVVPGLNDGPLRGPGDEDFAGLRPYAPGDTPRQISWRHVARTGTLLTRETDAPLGRARRLDWADTAAAGGVEARVSRLAAWVIALRRDGLPFALHLPAEVLPPGRGPEQALDALARLDPRPVPPATVPESSAPNDPAMRLTLAALAFALAPGALRQPWWITLLIVLLLGHTAVRTRRPIPALPTWLLGVLAGLALVLLTSTYGTLLGRDAGTALLALLVTLKGAESRRRRDGQLLALLGLFMTSTNFFFSQGPLTALHAILSAALLLSAAARWVTPPPAPPEDWRDTLVRAGGWLALAAPLALILFVLYPRPDRPLWQLPVQGQATTGLSNEIQAGEYGSLARSNAVAFRADFQGAVPTPGERYWRGPVYEAYDGLTWRQVRQSGSPSVEPTGPGWRYTLTLEPGPGPWLLALDAPVTLPEGAFLSTAFQAVSFRPGAAGRHRVTLESRPARLGRLEGQARLDFDLLLPAGQSPRALALARDWRALPPPARVQAALQFLRQGGFAYTLSPPTLPQQDRVDAFLFGTRQGFCEHYASAFAFLMRAAGLPARIVGGYLGGELNPDGGYLIVRQQDAHAWTEVWLPGQGWVRVDPTAVIAPARLNANVQTALSQPLATVPPAPTLLGRLGLRLDALQNRWNALVVDYDGEQQAALLSRSGLGAVGSGPYLLVLPLLMALALLPALLLVRRAARPADPAARALHDLTVKLGLPRAPGETPSAYVQRAVARDPHLAPLLADVLGAYQAARYAPGDPAGARRTLRAAVRRVRR